MVSKKRPPRVVDSKSVAILRFLVNEMSVRECITEDEGVWLDKKSVNGRIRRLKE